MDWHAIPAQILNESLIILDVRRSFFVSECTAPSDSEIKDGGMKPKTSSEEALRKLDISSDASFQRFLFKQVTNGLP